MLMIFHAVVDLTDLPFKSEIQQCNKKKKPFAVNVFILLIFPFIISSAIYLVCILNFCNAA